MSQSKCTSEYYSLLRRSTLRVPDVYRSAGGKIHLSLGLIPWRWSHQISRSTKSQPQEPQISHPNIIPMKIITHVCGPRHATAWRLTNNGMQTAQSLEFMECNFKGHATSDANRWLLHLRIWQHS